MPSRSLLLALAAALAFAGAAPAPAGAACALPNAKPVVRSARALVLARRELDAGFPGTRVYACLKWARPRPLGFVADEPGLALDQMTPIRLAGRHVGFGAAATDARGRDIFGRVAVVDLRTGRRRVDREAGRPGRDRRITAGVTDLRLRPDGTVAWIAAVADRAAQYQVHVAGPGWRRLLAAAPDVEPRSLRLAGDEVRWTQAGRPASASVAGMAGAWRAGALARGATAGGVLARGATARGVGRFGSM